MTELDWNHQSIEPGKPAPYTPQPIGAIVEFLVENNVHRVHLTPEGKPCSWGRIFRLAYPFGWNHYYCQQPCCDHRGKRDETGEDMGRVHVKCETDYTYINLYYCLDCSQIGRIAKEVAA